MALAYFHADGALFVSNRGVTPDGDPPPAGEAEIPSDMTLTGATDNPAWIGGDGVCFLCINDTGEIGLAQCRRLQHRREPVTRGSALRASVSIG